MQRPLRPWFNTAVLCSFMFLAVVFPPISSGQIKDVTNDQSTPVAGTGHDYIQMLDETVNPANGSLSLRFRLPVPKGRALSIPFGFAYDSNGVWHLTDDGAGDGGSIWISDTSFLSQGGWSRSAPTLNFFQGSASWLNGGGTCTFTSNFVFQDPSGGRHGLGLSTTNDNQGGDGTACGLSSYTSGGDDLLKATTPAATNVINPQVWIADLDGTVFGFTGSPWHLAGNSVWSALPAYIEDRNGNKIVLNDLGSGSFSYTDTLARTLVSSGSTSTTVSGLSNPFTLTWGTETSNYSINSLYLNPGGQCTSPPRVSGNQTAVTAITLPNQKTYQFFYDATYGLLNKIVYPTGGYVRYVWGLNSLSDTAQYAAGCNGISCNPPGTCLYRMDTPVVTDRYVSFDGSTEVLHQHFAYSTNWPNGSSAYWNTKQTTVTTSDLVRGGSFQTSYTYSPSGCGAPPPPNSSTSIASQCPVEQTVLYQDWNGATLRTVSKSWQDVNMLLSEQVALDNGKTSKTAYTYLNNNSTPLLTEKDEYDYGQGGPGALTRKTVTNYASFAATPIYSYAPSILDRPSSVITYDGNNNRVAETDYAYDQTSVSGVSNLPSGTHDETNYSPSYNNRGNATTVTRKCLQSCGDAVTTYTYDETGQALSTRDPNGNTTQYSYADNFDSPPSSNTNAYLTRITYPVTNGINHIENFKYAYADGQLIQSTDQNGQLTGYLYNDPLRRLTETDYPDGGETTISFNDSPPSPSVTTSRLMSSGNWAVNLSVMDGLGHGVETLLTPDPDCPSGDRTDSTYDGLGRVRTVTNPYCTTNDPTYGVTAYTYDSLGRTTQVAQPDSSLVATSYSGNVTTVTDEAGKKRQSTANALGHLTQVVEDPGGLAYATSYGYDTLDNLTSVLENGSRQRTFVYDSLSRLTSATNPESGTVSYSYDSGGNLLTKTDARGITTCFGDWGAAGPQSPVGCNTSTGYDALNRILKKTYSDGTPSALFTYDVASLDGLTFANPVGRLVKEATGDGLTSTWNSYDQMGRIANRWQCSPLNCGGTPYSKTFVYDFLGDHTSETYSYTTGTLTISYGYNGIARTTQVTSNYVDSQHPATLASAAHYIASGAISQLTFGNSLVETRAYNNRLEPTQLRTYDPGNGADTLNMTYGFNSGANNGDVASWAAAGQRNFSRSFNYDALNRLSSLSQTSGDATSCSSAFSLSWNYDAWGNRTDQNVTGGTCNAFHATVNTLNRFIDSPYQYDAAGNMTHDQLHAYSYDAENRITQVDGGSTASYVYDADGRRVRKTSGGSTTDYLYDLSDRIFSTFGPGCGGTGCWTAGAIYLNGQFLAEYYNSTTYFVHVDHLGTTRILTALDKSAYDNMDFLPFGEQIAGDTGTVLKFTGKERDSESGAGGNNGLDNFGARYMAGTLGRFLSSDPDNAGASPDSPQSWNAYSYTANNPINATDPDGLDCVYLLDNAFYTIRGAGDCSAAPGSATDVTYVPGTVDTASGTYNPATGTFSFGYTPYSGGLGQGIIGNVFPNSDNSNSGDLNPFARGVFTQLNRMPIKKFVGAVYGASVLIGATAGAACYYLCEEAGVATIGSGSELGQTANVLQRAASVVGNQEIRVSSEKVAEDAAERFLGQGSRELTQKYGSRVGQVIGRMSSDGTKIVRFDTSAASPHYNFVNLLTHGNLHVYF